MFKKRKKVLHQKDSCNFKQYLFLQSKKRNNKPHLYNLNSKIYTKNKDQKIQYSSKKPNLLKEKESSDKVERILQKLILHKSQIYLHNLQIISREIKRDHKKVKAKVGNIVKSVQKKLLILQRSALLMDT